MRIRRSSLSTSSDEKIGDTPPVTNQVEGGLNTNLDWNFQKREGIIFMETATIIVVMIFAYAIICEIKKK